MDFGAVTCNCILPDKTATTNVGCGTNLGAKVDDTLFFSFLSGS